MSESEFQEVGHCGGKIKITVITDSKGRKYSIGLSHNRPTPSSIFSVYALPQGIPVGTIQMGGIGQPWNPPPFPNCFSIFIASDSKGKFGHHCPRCKGYWRSDGAPSRWHLTCPYCGIRGEPHQFLTEGQLAYLEASCGFFQQALTAKQDGEYIIDMDAVADASGKDLEKPKFYYAEESQQNKFTCKACGGFNDILGTYGYCSCCGTRNDLQELEEKTIPSIRKQINSGNPPEGCVRDAVSAFDSMAGKYIEQIKENGAMTTKRKNRLGNLSFHNLRPLADELKSIADIDLFKGLSEQEVEQAILMFHRRHVHEHKGGEADEKYIQNSKDSSVRPKQALRETKESAHETAGLVLKMAKNLHEGFHDIFPPEEAPLKLHEEHMRNLKKG